MADSTTSRGAARKSARLAGTAAALVAATAWARQTQPTLIATDSFSYSAGALVGQNGGSGWTSAWLDTYGSGGNHTVTATGYSYTGLTTSGGRMTATDTGISEVTRDLPIQDDGLVYVRFITQYNTQTGGGTPNLRLFNGSSLTGGVGANGGSAPLNTLISILGSDLNALTDGSSSSEVSLSTQSLNLLQIDYAGNTTRLWVNPTLSTFNYSNPTSPDAVYPSLAPVFNRISFYTRGTVGIDEISVLYLSVPETSPFAAVLSVLASAGWFALRQRRQSSNGTAGNTGLPGPSCPRSGGTGG